jgi:F-type H+-transporting ATPase subunit b
MRIQEKLARAATASIPLALLAGAAHAEGKLNIYPDPVHLFILVGVFVALIFPTNALIFQPIFSALDERSKRIEGAQRRAEHIAQESEAVVERYRDSIRQARAEAESHRKDQLTAARSEQADVAASSRQDAERVIQGARAELERELEQAREGLRASAQDLARTAAERILGRAV